VKYFFDTDHLYATLLVFAAVLGIVFVPLNIAFISPFAQAFADFDITDLVFSRLRSDRSTTSDTSIVLVNIAHLPRHHIARQLERLAAHEPAAIGIDAFFRSPKQPSADSALAHALAKARHVVLVSKLTHFQPSDGVFDSLETSHPMFNRFAQNGFANVVVDSLAGFRTVRSFSPCERVRTHAGVNEHLAFSVQLARYLDSNAVKRFLDRQNEVESINYRGNYSHFYTLDANDVLDSTTDLGFVRGKIVLMGFLGYSLAEPSLEDTFFTPLNERSAGKTLPDMYGLVIHANIVSMILQGTFINDMPVPLSMLLAFLVCYANMVLFHYMIEHYERLYQPLSIVVQLTEWVVLIFLLVWLLDQWSYKADFTLTLTACTLSAGVFEIYSQSLKPIVITFRERWQERQSKRSNDNITTVTTTVVHSQNIPTSQSTGEPL